LVDLGIDERIIVKLIIKKRERKWTGLIWLGIGKTVAMF
jgi:hypothetical protein